ncbi:MAG: hypothetical protein ACR2FY_25165 [Pirellulaceae bacterium]
MKSLLFALAVILPLLGTAILGAEETDESYIQVEINGILETGIVTIGGETTGTIIKVGKVTWELDLAGNKDFIALAEKLNKQPVVVTGRYQQKPGVEIPVRHIVTVKTLKGAKGK